MILATGSRGGVIATLVALIMMLLRLPPLKKLGLAFAALVIGFTMWRVLPETTTRRLATLVSDDAGGTDAIASGDSRQYLLRKSLQYTMQHPLFGVGPGEFADHEGFEAKALGIHGAWHETHNTYTQISSEAGIPAALLFILAVVSTYRLFSGTLKQARARAPSPQNAIIAACAFCGLIALAAFSSSAFFLSFGYKFYFPALTGIAIAMSRAAQREWGLNQR
jgi:O-antigen ligase